MAREWKNVHITSSGQEYVEARVLSQGPRSKPAGNRATRAFHQMLSICYQIMETDLEIALFTGQDLRKAGSGTISCHGAKSFSLVSLADRENSHSD